MERMQVKKSKLVIKYMPNLILQEGQKELAVIENLILLCV